MIEVGDKVIYKTFLRDEIVEVFGIAEEPNHLGEKYAISYIAYDGSRVNRIVRRDKLEERQGSANIKGAKLFDDALQSILTDKKG